jgi:hypothetical protein
MATVGKKFVDPNWLEEGWYINLEPIQKTLFDYIWKKADHAGLVEFIPGVWSAQIGANITKKDIDDLMESLKDGSQPLIWFNKNKLWFPQYIRFQQTKDKTKSLSPGAPFHKKVFSLVKEHNLVEEIQKRDPVLLKDFLEENAVSEESKPYDSPTQGYDKGLSRSTSKSRSISESATTKTFKEAEEIIDAYPKTITNTDFALIAIVEDVIKELQADGVKDAKSYLLDEINKLNRRETPPPSEFFSDLKERSELPF